MSVDKIILSSAIPFPRQAIMSKTEYSRRLRDLLFTCGVNQRYHQTLEWRWVISDRAIRIVVGVLAIVGAIVAVPSLDLPWTGFIIGLISVVAAIILNVLPVGDWAKVHGEMFRLWSELRKDAGQEEHRACEVSGNVEQYASDRLCELSGKMESLHADEPAPMQSLLNRCFGHQLEAEWGPGIRTHEQVAQERERRKQLGIASRPSPSPAVVAGQG